MCSNGSIKCKLLINFFLSIFMYVSQSSGTVHKQQLSHHSRKQITVKSDKLCNTNKMLENVALRKEVVLIVCMTCSFKTQLAKSVFYMRSHRLHLLYVSVLYLQADDM